jgi:site-specific recombinase XerD
MIERQNYHDVRDYLAFSRDTEQLNPRTIETRRWGLYRLLSWADATPFGRAPDVRPTFPRWLLEHEPDAQPATLDRLCGVARLFFTWARDEYPRRYQACGASWRASLKMADIRKADAREHETFTLEEVREIMQLTPRSLGEERDRAAVAFLFLSGMRVTAFSTLPVKAVDLATRQVKQWPSMGVLTKLGKAATTVLLPIPDLLAVVQAWDDRVRPLGPEALWYPPLAPRGVSLEAVPAAEASDRRRGLVGKAIRQLCNRAGVTYHSPHKLRHGHAVFALEQARDIADLKAISMNLMHNSVSTTDAIYGGLSTRDTATRIGNLGGQRGPDVDDATLDALAAKLLSRLERNSQ